MEEIESEREDVYGRELVRSGRYMQQLEYEGRGLRRRAVDYEDLSDETESVVGGGDYDLYNHGDSTVAYAVQLAMRDKEDQLVEKALERIRRAQMLGKKNVRLSQRELDALERKRQQTDSSNAARRNKGNAGSAANSRPTSRRNGHTVPQEQPGAYPPFAPDASRNRTTGASGRPSSSSSANRPRTPTTQSLRPQQSGSPLRPSYPPYPDRVPPASRSQSMQQPMYARPLPDEPQWAPPYYNPLQMSAYAPGQPPYQPQLPSDLRVGPQCRMSYPAGVSPSQGQQRQAPDRRPPRGTQQVPSESDSGVSSEGEETESSGEESDDVQIVQVRERPGAGPQRRTVSGGSRGPPRPSR